jgi:DNA cross-link repair 1A protein
MEEQLRIDKTLYLFGSYAIGKERLFMEVARVFNKKIVVSKSKLDLISCFNWPKKDMVFIDTI